MVQIQSKKRNVVVKKKEAILGCFLFTCLLLLWISQRAMKLSTPPILDIPNADDTKVTATTSNRLLPLFVMHVGPPKTGTTSLQHAIEQYNSMLIEDNYYFTGNSSFADHFNICVKRVRKANLDFTIECWKRILDTMESHRALGHNVILSNEVISVQAQFSDFRQVIENLLSNWKPNVLIVVGYRHLHNFFPSTHYELQKNQRWPSVEEKGKYVTPFVKFWRYNHGKYALGPIPTPSLVISQFRSFNYSVSVLDIETKEQITEFFCNILPQASQTCNYITRVPPQIPKLNENNKGLVNYDSLAILAFTRRYLKKEQTRKYLRYKIQAFNEKTLNRGPNDFVLSCLDHHEEKIFLEESKEHARLAGFSHLENKIEIDFMKSRAKKKFCSINATVVFYQEEWQNFFRKAKTEW
jgi:hypothetical protein